MHVKIEINRLICSKEKQEAQLPQRICASMQSVEIFTAITNMYENVIQKGLQ